MTLNDLSSEQQEFVHLALSGKNVLCDACIGSGKTSTINVLCDAYPPERRILYLTYNRLLKLDAKDKIKNHNVLVQNYHGFASLLLNKKGIRNCGQGEQLAMVLEKKIPIPPIDTLIIDEYQDINDEIAELLKYIRSQNPGLQIVAVGDMKQKIYDDTALDVWEFMQDFLGRHEQVVFTKCFRISHDLAERLGNIWGKTINGVNGSCIVEQMSVDEVTEFLNKQNACIESCFDSGAMFNLPCKANRKTHEVFAVECCASPDNDDSFSYAEVKINGKDYPINFIDDILLENNVDDALDELYRIQQTGEYWQPDGNKTLDDAIHECRWAILKDAIQKRGHEAVADFVGTDISSDTYDRVMDETEAQMPDEEFERFWEKYI